MSEKLSTTTSSSLPAAANMGNITSSVSSTSNAPQKPNHADRIKARVNELLPSLVPPNSTVFEKDVLGLPANRFTISNLNIDEVRRRLGSAVYWQQQHRNYHRKCTNSTMKRTNDYWSQCKNIKRNDEAFKRAKRLIQEIEEIAERQVDEEEAMESGET